MLTEPARLCVSPGSCAAFKSYYFSVGWLVIHSSFICSLLFLLTRIGMNMELHLVLGFLLFYSQGYGWTCKFKAGNLECKIALSQLTVPLLIKKKVYICIVMDIYKANTAATRIREQLDRSEFHIVLFEGLSSQFKKPAYIWLDVETGKKIPFSRKKGATWLDCDKFPHAVTISDSMPNLFDQYLPELLFLESCTFLNWIAL